MKTSIIKLSVNETLWVNGGVDTVSSINTMEIISVGREIISSHPKQIIAVGLGGFILVTVSVAINSALNKSKAYATINLLKEAIKMATTT